MIKTLLNADEEPSPKNEAVSAEKNIQISPNEEFLSATNLESQPANNIESNVDSKAEGEENRNIFEIPEEANSFSTTAEMTEQEQDFSQMSEDDLEKMLRIEEENYKSFNDEPLISQEISEKTENTNSEPFSFAEDKKEETNQPITYSGTLSNYEPESQAETIRKSGLAYSAAIVLLASVVFMMILGWFADLLLGSSPWGIVGGIILGGLIGFIQFFRIASSIFKQ